MKKRSLSYRAKKLFLEVTMIIGSISLFFSGGKKDSDTSNQEGATEIDITIGQDTESTTGKGKETDKEKESKETTISLRKVKNKKKNLKYYDKSGNEKGELKGVKKVLTLNYNKDKKIYRSAIILPNGKIEYHYLKEDDLKQKAINEIKVKNVEDLKNVMQVSAKSGAWAREKRLVDRDTKDAELLDPSTYVLAYKTTSNVKDNTYDWRKVVYINSKGKLNEAYIADDYLMNTDISKYDGKEYEVCTKKGIPLKMREEHNVTSNVITKINPGEKVYLVKNIKAVHEEKEYKNGAKYTWFYVAYHDKKEDVLKFGWCAYQQLKEDGYAVDYLQDSTIPTLTLSEEKNEKDKTIVKMVNTNSENGVNLKLRKKPGKDSEIISEIENGATIYIKESDLNNMKEKDNYKWVYIETQSGKKGYVASEYIKDKAKKKAKKYKPHELNISHEGKIKGYIGIDVNSTNITSDNLKKIFRDKLTVQGTNSDVVASNKYVPDYVIIKLGSFGYGNHVNIDIIKEVDLLVNICEEYNVPYGFYFYSTSITKDEADAENKVIKKSLKRYTDNDHFALGFYLDREAQGRTIYHTNSGQNTEQIKKQTEVVNYQIKDLQDKLPNMDIKLYTETRTLGLNPVRKNGKFTDTLIISAKNLDYNLLDKNVRKNMWIAEDANFDTHPYAIKKYMNQDEISTRQLEISQGEDKEKNINRNVYMYENGEKKNIIVDVDFMNKEYFENCLKKKNIKISKEEKDIKYSYNFNNNRNNLDDLAYSTTNYNITFNNNPKVKTKRL